MTPENRSRRRGLGRASFFALKRPRPRSISIPPSGGSHPLPVRCTSGSQKGPQAGPERGRVMYQTRQANMVIIWGQNTTTSSTAMKQPR